MVIIKSIAGLWGPLVSMILMNHAIMADDYFRRAESLAPIVGRSIVVEEDDLCLVNRLTKSYRIATALHQGFGQSLWGIIFDAYQAPIHRIFMTEDLAASASVLRNPGSCDMFFGVDDLTASASASFPANPAAVSYYAAHCLDDLIRFAEVIGAIPLDCPESYYLFPIVVWTADEILQHIERRLGQKVYFPNPYPNEYGVMTSRGIASYRALQSLYQAWRIKQLLQGIENPRVLEIGAGIGRTAYYARMFGIRDYTIIDLPFSSICSGYFLGRTLGEAQIHLLGEPQIGKEQCIKILPPSTFLEGNDSYDLIINADSLTEMDPDVARAYWRRIEKSTPIFLSINHEVNSFTVNELICQSTHTAQVERYLYWMRKGYVGEVVRFK